MVPEPSAFVPPPPATTVEALVRPVPRTAAEARAFELAPALWCLALPLPYPRLRSVNCYLLELDDGLCLVDCGSYLEPGWDGVVHALGCIGHRAQDIRLLVCTHLHQDHAGLAWMIGERVGCTLARPEGPKTAHDALRDRGLPAARRRETAIREGVPASMLAAMTDAILAGDGDHPRAHFDRRLSAGETIATRSGVWEVVPLPGHSPAHIGLFEPRRRWLLSADLVFESGIPYFEFGTDADPLADHLGSIDRALAVAPERLLPGHGRPLQGRRAVRDRLSGAMSATMDVVDVARDVLREGDCTGYELSMRFDGDDPHLDWRQSALSIALCVLEHLVLAGEADASVGDDGVRRFRAAASPTRRRQPAP